MKQPTQKAINEYRQWLVNREAERTAMEIEFSDAESEAVELDRR